MGRRSGTKRETGDPNPPLCNYYSTGSKVKKNPLGIYAAFKIINSSSLARKEEK